MGLIPPTDDKKRVMQAFRLHPEIVEKLEKIAKEVNETKTHVLESLLRYAFKAYEKEKAEKEKKKKEKG